MTKKFQLQVSNVNNNKRGERVTFVEQDGAHVEGTDPSLTLLSDKPTGLKYGDKFIVTLQSTDS